MNSLRTLARSTAPQVGQQRRRFVDGLVNAKNELKATQELFQDPAKAHLHGADDPTYLKKGGGQHVVRRRHDIVRHFHLHGAPRRLQDEQRRQVEEDVSRPNGLGAKRRAYGASLCVCSRM
eukprot:g1236.t1